MTTDRQIDPVTRDFVAAAKGAFKRCDVIANKVALSYLTPLGMWEGAPDIGHRFDEIKSNTAEARTKLKDLAIQAIKWLLDSGEIKTADAVVEYMDRTKARFQVNAYLPDGTPITFGPYFVPVGGG